MKNIDFEAVAECAKNYSAQINSLICEYNKRMKELIGEEYIPDVPRDLNPMLNVDEFSNDAGNYFCGDTGTYADRYVDGVRLTEFKLGKWEKVGGEWKKTDD